MLNLEANPFLLTQNNRTPREIVLDHRLRIKERLEEEDTRQIIGKLDLDDRLKIKRYLKKEIFERGNLSFLQSMLRKLASNFEIEKVLKRAEEAYHKKIVTVRKILSKLIIPSESDISLEISESLTLEDLKNLALADKLVTAKKLAVRKEEPDNNIDNSECSQNMFSELSSNLEIKPFLTGTEIEQQKPSTSVKIEVVEEVYEPEKKKSCLE